MMEFLSLEPFVPSGSDLEVSKQFFQELGFSITWDGGDYIGFANGNCRFILQKYENRDFAENFMLSVKIPDADLFYKEAIEKELPGRFGVRINPPVDQPYGREVNVVDLAGVCWHFVEG